MDPSDDLDDRYIYEREAAKRRESGGDLEAGIMYVIAFVLTVSVVSSFRFAKFAARAIYRAACRAIAAART